MITLLQYNASIVTPTDDAYLYNHIINDSGIFTGVEVTTQGGNIINVSDGRGIILGRNFVVEAQTMLRSRPAALSPVYCLSKLTWQTPKHRFLL